MESSKNPAYSGFTDLHFAVWNMIKPVNYIWIDFVDRCVRCGVKDEPTDAIQDERAALEALKDRFVELISYDAEGKPVLSFDDSRPVLENVDYQSYPTTLSDLELFLDEMEEIDLLGWKEQWPSLREGLCWRIDCYYEGGEKHLSGQSRFPEHWTLFGKSLNGLVKKAQDAASK